MTHKIPNYLGKAFDTQMSKARVKAADLYDSYWETVTDFVVRPCFDCGRNCKVETASKDDKYAPCCRKCQIGSYMEGAGAELADRMSVC